MAHDDEYAAGQKKNCSQKCNDFMKGIWNSEKKEFIGRTGGSWAKIGIFYLIFYSCLAGFFAIMLVGFFSTVDSKEPTQQGMYSLIKGNPGMGFRPMFNIESTLIKFSVKDPKTYENHIKSIDKLLESYETQPDHAIECTADNKPGRKDDKVCEFKISQLGDTCTKENNYGYTNGTPCVLLKINKVFAWQPIPFENTSTSEEQDTFAHSAKVALGDRIDPNYIGVTCDGENEGDHDNVFSVDYHPRNGFSYNYFPYYNHAGYLPPLVFVQFDVRRGALTQIWCKLWVKNIKHHKNDKAGSTHFELLIDN